MNCDKAQEQLAALVYDEVSGDEYTELKTHVDGCDSCRHQLDEMKKAADVLQQALDQMPELKLDDDRRNSVLAGKQNNEAVKKPRPRMFRIMLQAAAAIAFLLIAGAFVLSTFPKKHASREAADVAMTKAKEANAQPPPRPARRSIWPGRPSEDSKSAIKLAREGVAEEGPHPAGAEAMDVEPGPSADNVAHGDVIRRPGPGKEPPKTKVEWKHEEGRQPSVFVAKRVNAFVLTAKDRYSTFAIDTDTASYTVMRKYIHAGQLPPKMSVRMEEYVNAFDYNYSRRGNRVFSIQADAAPSPFGKGLLLVKIGVRGKVIGRDGRKASHLVFAVDTSGSMARKDRLPLVKKGLLTLVSQLDPKDRISMVTYGREARLVLENVPAAKTQQITDAIKSLQCGESTFLAKGVRLAYEIGKRHFRTGQINSVILCSDGMANLGPQDSETILADVDKYRRQGISFNSVGFGMGNYNDNVLEQMANKGDGSYVFVDSEDEAKRVFAEEMGKRLNIIAKDAKIQVEFDPRRVRRYRLVGYENRDIADKDFRNDKIDAGEVGSGQSATALYEIELEDTDDPLRAPDLGTVYVRYQNVESGKVEEISSRLTNSIIMRRTPKRHPRFFLAAAAAEFAEILRGSEHAAKGSLDDVQRLVEEVAAQLPMDKQVQGFRQLVHKSKGLPQAQQK